MKFIFPFHILDVIPTPLTNYIIFQDGEIEPPIRNLLELQNAWIPKSTALMGEMIRRRDCF
jgi:hypothetical protein